MRDERQMVFPWFDQAAPKDLSLQELKRQALKARRERRELVRAVMQLPESLRTIRGPRLDYTKTDAALHCAIERYVPEQKPRR